MSDDEEPEFEVETVTEARVAKKNGRGKKLIWQYRVKWKGYPTSDNTWEPKESFVGSESMIERFWQRADTNGRDIEDLSLFQPGENFIPIGPPPRLGRRKSTKGKETLVTSEPLAGPSTTATSAPPASPPPTKRKRTPTEIIEISDERPIKKTRGRRSAKPSSPPPARQSSPPPAQPQIPLPGRSRAVPARRAKPSEQPIPSPASTRRSPKKSRQKTPEIIPDSDQEDNDDASLQKNPKSTTHASQHTDVPMLDLAHPDDDDIEILESDPLLLATSDVGASSSSAVELREEVQQISKSISEDLNGDTSIDIVARTLTLEDTLPSHRARAAKPLVKLADDFAGLDGAISAKARLRGRTTTNDSGEGSTPRKTRGSSSKAGPGRSSPGMKKNTSSLLTFQKGALKTVKGNYSAPGPSSTLRTEIVSEETVTVGEDGLFGDELPDDDNPPGLSTPRKVTPPTGEDLLKLAGLDAKDAEELEDFVDDAPAVAQGPESEPEPEKGSLKQSLLAVAETLFPSSSSTVASTLSGMWKRSTIFGPLGLGSDISNHATPPPETLSPPFYLRLDTSISLPVVLADATSPPNGGPDLAGIVDRSPKGPPGKFYRGESALSLLDTLRTGGPSARLMPAPDVTEEQNAHFERFRLRLNDGDLFVAMAGVEVLAFCSSDDVLISHRLNLPASLFNTPGCVLVARVVIENYSAYAEAAYQADTVPL